MVAFTSAAAERTFKDALKKNKGLRRRREKKWNNDSLNNLYKITILPLKPTHASHGTDGNHPWPLEKRGKGNDEAF